MITTFVYERKRSLASTINKIPKSLGSTAFMEHNSSDFVNSRHLRHLSSGSYPFYGAFTAASRGFKYQEVLFTVSP